MAFCKLLDTFVVQIGSNVRISNTLLTSIVRILYLRIIVCRYAKVKSGEIKVENWHDYINRKILQARDEEAKKQGKK